MTQTNRLAYIIAAVHSLGGLALGAAAIVHGWPWPVYLIAGLALLIGLVISALQ